MARSFCWPFNWLDFFFFSHMAPGLTCLFNQFCHALTFMIVLPHNTHLRSFLADINGFWKRSFRVFCFFSPNSLPLLWLPPLYEPTQQFVTWEKVLYPFYAPPCSEPGSYSGCRISSHIRTPSAPSNPPQYWTLVGKSKDTGNHCPPDLLLHIQHSFAHLILTCLNCKLCGAGVLSTAFASVWKKVKPLHL